MPGLLPSVFAQSTDCSLGQPRADHYRVQHAHAAKPGCCCNQSFAKNGKTCSMHQDAGSRFIEACEVFLCNFLIKRFFVFAERLANRIGLCPDIFVGLSQ